MSATVGHARRSAVRLAIVSCLTAFALVACAPTGGDETPAAPGPIVEPGVADLSDPQSAVRSYLDWVSYAYRTARSEVASHTMTALEGVRVDSYIEFNRQLGRTIDQEIVAYDKRSESVEDTTAVVAAGEDWRYRYVDMQTGDYSSGDLRASYEVTYTLVFVDGSWLVDRVDATPLTPVE